MLFKSENGDETACSFIIAGLLIVKLKVCLQFFVVLYKIVYLCSFLWSLETNPLIFFFTNLPLRFHHGKPLLSSRFFEMSKRTRLEGSTTFA